MSEPKSLWAQHIEDACPEGPFPPEESTRHPKWKQVPPGTVIPAGQPYRVEYADKNLVAAREHRGDIQPFFADPRTVRPGGDPNAVYFVDSSWKPPLVLPTEPTWGMVVWRDDSIITARGDRWRRSGGQLVRDHLHSVSVNSILDFIPLTDEQVARIEAAR